MGTSIMAAMFILFCLVCCFISFMCGFLYAKNKEIRNEPRAQPELNPEDERKAEKEKKEFDNFMTYDGSEQT